MSFYQEIAKYYDLIFPMDMVTVEFISRIAGNQPKEILDIACGTGGYSIELGKLGYHVTAVDLDSQMVENLKTKVSNLDFKVKFLQANMLDLNNKLEKNSFETAFCIGNSIVHLDSLAQINDFFIQVKETLKSGGSLIIQTINYDRVISKSIKSLPTIYNKMARLSFERLYRYEKEQNKVYFKTVLSVDNQSFENEIPLYPLQYDDAMKMLKLAGFKEIQCFGDFEGKHFDKESSYMMVFHAK